jgi:chromate transporter
MNCELFTTFFRIGIFTIGGGYAMIPLIEEEVVNKKQWVSKDEMLDLIAIAQSCPGVFAINIATFIGYKLRKTKGAITTTLGTALPSFLIILAIAIFFKQFEDNKVVAAIFRGIRPAVVALIAVPTFRLGQRAKLNKFTIWIPIVCALAIWALGVSPIYIIIIAAIGGYIYGKIKHKDTEIQRSDLEPQK